jgi:hypothetical protein
MWLQECQRHPRKRIGVSDESHLLNRNLFQIINLRNVASIRFHTVNADNMQVFQGFAIVVRHTGLARVGNHGTQGIAITILASKTNAIRVSDRRAQPNRSGTGQAGAEDPLPRLQCERCSYRQFVRVPRAWGRETMNRR